MVMRSITKSREPWSLRNFRNAGHSNWDEIHLLENQHVYNDCIQQCMTDQSGLCGYTEIVLDASRHIDHYVRKGMDSRMTFQWTDMVAAIKDDRFGADYKDQHVQVSDYDRVNRKYLYLYNPVTEPLSGTFVYSSDGSILPANSADLKAKKTIEIFNLNEKSLKERRKQLMESARRLKEGGLSAPDICDCLRTEGFQTCLEYELSQLFQ